MGNRRARKLAFLAKHPICCFCGGNTTSEEPDHVPGRVFFKDRQWPEGYEFPSCASCNRASRHAEQVVALLSRSYPDPTTESERAQLIDLMRSVAHNYPSVLAEMQPSVRQLRDAAKKYSIPMAPGEAYAQIKAMSVSGPLVNKAIADFARKLFCALYYMHSGRVLGHGGCILFRWYSNLQIESDAIPRELAPLVRGFPKLERSRMNLDDQFFYRWGLGETNSSAIFLALFRRSFAILGIVHEDKSALEIPEGAAILHPYSKTELT